MPGTVGSKQAWARTLRFFGHKCAYCRTDKNLTRDHWVPRSLGGDGVAGNLVPACVTCNAIKMDTPPHLLNLDPAVRGYIERTLDYLKVDQYERRQARKERKKARVEANVTGN